MRPRRPTRKQKQIIDGLRLTVANYLVVSESKTIITLYNKSTGKTITRYKNKKDKKERKV